MDRVPIGRRRFLGAATAALASACSKLSAGETTKSSVQETVPPLTTTTTESTTTLDPIQAPPVALDSDPFTLGVASGDPDANSVVLWTRLIGHFQESVPVVWEVATPDEQGDMSLVATGLTNASPEDAMSLHVVAEGLSPDSKYMFRFRAGAYASAVGHTRTMPDDMSQVLIGVSSCQLRSAGFWQAHDDIAAADLNLMVWLGDYTYRPKDLEDLDDYRDLHARYRSDPALQAAHASCPWFMGLDDNDVHNDYTASTGGNPVSRQSAYQAWWEHQPTRLPKPTGPSFQVYRHLDLGTLARIILFDTRQYAEPAVDLLGAEQREWAEEAIASQHRWTLFASPVVVSEMVGGSPDLIPYSWPAHSLDRDWIHDQFRLVENPVVVSGDLHTAMVTSVAGSDQLPVAVELMAPAISSRLRDNLAGTAPFLPFVNPLVKHIDTRQGWMKLDLTNERIVATFRATDAQIDDDDVVRVAQFVVSPGSPQAVKQS